MFGIGETELVIILAFGFMIFGPDKLPGMGRTIGRALRQFREAQEGFTQVVQSEVMDPLQEAMGDPLDSGTRKQHRATAEERAAALAQDADREVADEGKPQRKETFAERKARLAAEREAREAEALAQAREADADLAQEPEASQGQPEAEPAQQQEPEAPDTSAAALYALGGRSSFGAAKEQAAAEAAEKAAADVAAAVDQAVAETTATVEDDTDGKEDGTREA